MKKGYFYFVSGQYFIDFPDKNLMKPLFIDAHASTLFVLAWLL